MLSERPWKLEAVLGLFAAWTLAMAMGMLISPVLSHALPGNTLAGSRFFQFVISAFFLHGLGFVFVQIFLISHRVKWREFLGWPSMRWKTVLRVLLTTVIVLPVALGLNALCAALLIKVHVAPVEQESMKILQISITTPQRIVFGFAAIFLAPLVEESIFRGILYPAIKQLGNRDAALYGTSFLFALIHMNLVTFVPLFVLALVLVWLLETTDTLIAPIVAHSCFNTVNFFIFINQGQFARWWNELIESIRSGVGG